MRALRESAEGSSVVFLDCSFETCYERIRSSDRPLVRSNTREQLYEFSSIASNATGRWQIWLFGMSSWLARP